MADMVTVQELENAKIDARTIGESVNENKIVTPRYGAPFKSMPMIAEEMQGILGTIIAGGVPAGIVLDASGKTQQHINYLNLLDKKTIFEFMTLSEFNEFRAAPPRTCDFTTVINSALASMNVINSGGTSQVLYLPAVAGGYLTTDTIWMPKYTGIIGDGGGLWQTDFTDVNKKSSYIHANFADPYKFVVSSDTRVISTNTRLPFSTLIEGNTMDGGLYSWSDGIVLKGISIGTQSRVFGGIKLIGAISSFIDRDVVVRGCDYGYVTSACWNASHIGSSLSYKCGYLGYDALNGTIVEGYHNNNGAPTLTATNLINFFSAGYSIPYALLNTSATTFGCVLRKSYGISGNKVIAEGSDFPVVLEDRCQASFGTIYAEKVKQCAMLTGNQCQLDVGSAVGGLVNGAAIHPGTHARINIQNYYMIADVKHIYDVSGWGDTAVVKIPSRYFPEFHQNIIWNDKTDNIVYLSSNGVATNNGANYSYPTNLTEALKRISGERERYDKTLTATTNKALTLYCINAGDYTIDEAYLTLYGVISIKRKATLSATDVVLKLNNLVYLNNCVLNISGVKLDIANKNFDFVSFARNAPFTIIAGINSLYLSGCTTTFLGVNNGLVSFSDGADSITSVGIRSGSIVGTGDIVQRAETQTVGNTVNVAVGESCAVDALIKAKTTSGINISKENQGIIRLPWLLQNTSVTYDPPSVASGTSVSTTVTLTGAKVGDIVQAAFTQYNADIEINAVVSAVNTVTVKFKNTSAGAVDLASGMLSVKKV